MLTAFTKDGKKLCLGNDYKKESLIYFRKKEEFFCPVCAQKVILKLGDKRIFHFSHLKNSECNDHFENESNYHLQGKKQLYQWLKKQKIPSELEFYDKKIRQRPDIMFFLNGKKYALEFQCATISEAAVLKRTKSYIKSSYVPLWIVGAKHLHRRSHGAVSLSNFHYLFLRGNENSEWLLPFYCPDSQMFIHLYSLHPFSPQNALADLAICPLHKMNQNQFLNFGDHVHFQSNDWRIAIRQVKLNCSQYYTALPSSFLSELYQNRLNLFLLPPEIGLPVHYAPFFVTSPLIWQAYIYIDLFQHTEPDDLITVESVQRTLSARIKKKQIAVRLLPQYDKGDYTLAITDYLAAMEKIGVLRRRNNNHYSVMRKIKVPKSVTEQQELEAIFYQKFSEIFFDTIESRRKDGHNISAPFSRENERNF